jgi:SAM-dependent methyltransferase
VVQLLRHLEALRVSAASRAPLADTGLREAERIAATVLGFLPAGLAPYFDARFTRSHLLFDEYVYRLTVQVLAEAQLDRGLRDWRSAQELVDKAGLDARASVVPVDWMLRHLAARGALARRDGPGGARFQAVDGLPSVDAGSTLAEQREHDPGCLPSYALAEAAARDYPRFLRGERSGEEILLSPTRLSHWAGYFSNDNSLYAVNNRVGAAALGAWLPPGPHAILELGGGLGSATLAAFEWLAAEGRLGDVDVYRFTEPVAAFLRRAQRLAERVPEARRLTFASLDMNRPFGEQGVAAESVSVVYAVNTLHVAHDLAFTLGEIRRALRPGGQVIVSECIRPLPEQTLYPEFIFNLMETFRGPRLDPRYRPNGGFLTPEQWTAALDASGFGDLRVFPDIARMRRLVPVFCIAAIGGRRPA